MSIRKYAPLNFISFVCVYLISFLVGYTLQLVLLPEEFGEYMYIFTISSMFLVGGSLGIQNANIYFIGKGSLLRDMLGNLLFYLFSFIITVKIVFTILENYTNFIIPGSVFTYYLIIGLTGFTLLLTMFQALQKFVAYNLFNLLRPLVQFTAIIVLLLFVQLNMNIAVFTAAFSFGILVLFMLFLLLKESKWKISLNFPLLLKSVKYGSKSQLANIFQYINYRVDFLVIQWLIGSESLAYYGVATAFAEIILMIPRSFSTILFPKISNSDDNEDKNLITERLARIVVFLTLIASVFIGFVGKFIIEYFYKAEYVNSIEPIFILIPGLVMLSLTNILAHNLMGRNFPHYSSIANSIGMVVTIVLDILLIPKYGINGAAFASAAAYSFATIGLVVLYKRVTPVKLMNLLILKKEDIRYIRSILNLRK